MTFVYTRNDSGLFVCPHCGVTKKNQNTMYYHLVRHTGNLPYECKTCNHKYQFKQTLENHIASKHPTPEKEVHRLRCPVPGCEFQTLTNGNRIIHFMRKHCKGEIDEILQEREATLICKGCTKTFQSNTAFHYHATSCIRLTDQTRRRNLQEIMG